MKYPIFMFNSHLTIFDTPDAHESYLEPYALDRFGTLLDSEGRRLRASDGGNDRVIISDTLSPPDLDLLRGKLNDFLERKGWKVDRGAPLEALISAAREACESEHGIRIKQPIATLRRWLGLAKTPK